MSKYPIMADLHTHTVASKHAVSTLHENMVEARNKSLLYVATTDHFFYSDDKMERLNEMARTVDLAKLEIHTQPKIIAGVEGNLGHFLSTEDAQKINKSLKWRLVGCHSWFLNIGATSINNLPEYYEATAQKSDSSIMIKATAFAHIERNLTRFLNSEDPKHVEEILYQIVDIAIKNRIFLEINEHSLHINRATTALMKKWVRYAKEHGAKFCLGTDAHYCEEVGNFTEVEKFIDALDLYDNYILNYDKRALELFANK